MISKLTLWTCLGLAVLCAVAALVCLCLGWWQALGFTAALTVFFRTAAYLVQPSVEAYNNDRDWRDAYKL